MSQLPSSAQLGGAKAATGRLIRWALAVCVALGPVAFAVGGLLEPAVHASGATTIEGNAAEPPLGNDLHLVGFFTASLLLPASMVGLAALAYARTPWAATLGGALGVLGWMPLAALTALEDLGYAMAVRPEGSSYAGLYDAFSTDAVMNTYLITYIVGHLAGYVVLGAALIRAQAVPAWAGWALIASSPLTLGAFVVPGRPLALAQAALVVLVAGSLPPAWALARRRLPCARA